MKRRPPAARALRAATVMPALFCAALAAAPAPPSAAEGLGRVISRIPPSIGGPAIPSRLRIARVLGPKLDIDRTRAAGRVAGLSLSADGGLLLAVLADGSARLWDLARGAQIGDALGGGVGDEVVAGAVGAGSATVARRDGSMGNMRPGRAVWPLPSAPAPLDPAAAVLASDGGALAFRGGDGAWRVMRGGEVAPLARAAPAFRPVLSPDGAWAVYRTARGAAEALETARPGAAPRPLVGCAAPTAGVFLSGGRIVVGDERGAVCGWRLPPEGGADPLFSAFRAHGGPVRAAAADRRGDLFATRGERDGARVWSAAPRPRLAAEFGAADAAPGPLALDADRRWLFVGEDAGKVAILSWRGDAPARAATLVFTDDGWAVLDAVGRFDGSQDGVDALSWTGATAEGESRTRPVDAFSENWFEPGLQGKLDDDSPRFLNPDPGDLPAEGFSAPPAVSIDPPGPPAADGRTEIVARPEESYPIEEVSEIRLYHNGKLTPAGERADGVWRHRVRLLPGENSLAAVGVGPGGIEGPRTVIAANGPGAPARRPTMRLVAAGISDYSSSLGPTQNLKYSRNDAEAVSAALRARAGALFDSVDSAVLLDSAARLADIENGILRRSPAGKSVSGDDVLVVYLAGHGYALPDEGGREWYFMPWTDDPRAPRKVNEAVREYGLSGRALMSLLARAEARRVFLVLDSCYSGAAVEGFAFDDAARKALRRLARVGGIHVLAAAQAEETAVEVDLERHGALTFLVLEGMGGAADENRDGTVSVKEIIAHADRGLPLLSHNIFGGALDQRSVGYSRGADFALAKL